MGSRVDAGFGKAIEGRLLGLVCKKQIVLILCLLLKCYGVSKMAKVNEHFNALLLSQE